MSLRKAKQILALQKKPVNDVHPEEEQTQVEDPDELPKKKNMFSAFQQSSDSEEQDKKEQQSQVKPGNSASQSEENTQQKGDVQSEHTQSKKPKKKKPKKKKEGKKPEQEEDIEEVLRREFGDRKPEEEEEKDDGEHYDLLDINENKFRYERELSKYFKDAKEEAEIEPEGMNKREKRYMKMMARLKMKKSVLTPGIKDYFPITEKFSVEVKDHKIIFEPSKKYDVLQEEYQTIKNSNDVQEMYDFLQRNPFHTDALYNIGEFLRLKGNYKEADGLIQRILYIYEQSCMYEMGMMIKEPRPVNYFPYERFSSSLFMSMFKYIDILGKKGCYKAALEYNKLLLKLNKQDPTASLFCLDYNACSAKQYDYLLQFADHYADEFYRGTGTQRTTVYWLPNIMYSAALGKFLLSLQTKQTKTVEELIIQPSLVFLPQHLDKALNLRQVSCQQEASQVLLLRCLILYPRVIRDIAAKNDYAKQFVGHPCLKGSQKKTMKELLDNAFFTAAADNYFHSFLNIESESDSKGLLKNLETYVIRAKILWKANNVILWVKAAIGFLVDNLEKLDYQGYVGKLCLKEQCEGIPPLPFKMARYENVAKANFSDHVERIDLNNIQDNQGAGRQAPQGQQVNMGHSPFRLFIESLLPWMNLPGTEEADPDMPVIEQDHD